MNILYTATAHATGDGRNGHARSDDGILDLDLRMPKELAAPAARPTRRCCSRSDTPPASTPPSS